MSQLRPVGIYNQEEYKIIIIIIITEYCVIMPPPILQTGPDALCFRVVRPSVRACRPQLMHSPTGLPSTSSCDNKTTTTTDSEGGETFTFVRCRASLAWGRSGVDDVDRCSPRCAASVRPRRRSPFVASATPASCR